MKNLIIDNYFIHLINSSLSIYKLQYFLKFVKFEIFKNYIKIKKTNYFSDLENYLYIYIYLLSSLIINFAPSK